MPPPDLHHLIAVALLTAGLASASPASAATPAQTPPPSTVAAQRLLAEAVAAIRHADFRGDRGELLRRARQLEAPMPAALDKYRLYWRGFAHWRRVLNGFNETTPPADLRSDSQIATAAFRAALLQDPAFEDARSALAGSLMNEMFLVSGKPPEERAEVYRQGIAAVAAVHNSGQENPRSLWILGGSEMGAPPPWGGDLAKAAAIYERALAAARVETAAAASEPWVPRWGAAESLMSLAYLYSRGAATDRGQARAYALGALALVPEWRYVADILLPAIEALPKTEPAKAAARDCARNLL